MGARHPSACFSGIVALFLVSVTGWGAPVEKLGFNRDVLPVLSENCFACHGHDPRKREAKLRLDEVESATRDRGGYAAIVPGDPEESEMIYRITTSDLEDRMPPPESNKQVTPGQIQLLRRWIQEGADYEKHWAFSAPRRAPLPTVKADQWPRNSIDRFVLARLEQEGLSPAAEAKPETWLRRASFDLTGLPPTPQNLDAFVADVSGKGEAAYIDAVDHLIASPHYGERRAIAWLDAARYADTHGFNNDSARTMWRWRDWVIEAFNRNLPYDQFITEQLAGDLLPNPTLDQRIATGFGRNHVISSEGGIIQEEYRVEYVADRVRTVSTAWLGLTMECARCHDHKFDPVSQKDYYRLFAFFNNVPEHGEDGRIANAVPMIPAPTSEQQAMLAQDEAELGALDKRLRHPRQDWKWRSEYRPRIETLAKHAQADAEAGTQLLETLPGFDKMNGNSWLAEPENPAPTIQADQIDFKGKDGLTITLWLRPAEDNPRDVPLLSALDHLGSTDDSQYGRGRELRLVDGELELRLSSRFPMYALVIRTDGADIRPEQWRHVALSYSGGKNAAAVRFFVDGKETRVRVLNDGLISEPQNTDFLLGADNAKDATRWHGALADFRSFQRTLDTSAVRARFAAEALPRALASMERGTISDLELGCLREVLLAEDPETSKYMAQRLAVWERYLALNRNLPTTMVMEELPQPRQAFVLNRGQYDSHGDPVEAGVPEDLLAPWPAGAPHNRLGLAQWFTQPGHPLTGRVVVNRFWAELFGIGLVKTVEDLGSKGEWPSHPELLDWLAREFVDGGWDVKAFMKMMVLSATYRQDSSVPPELLERDPENRLLARGPRVRLPAELIRDQALAVSGLLSRHVGGPSVYPYQPESLYEGIVVGADYPGTHWGQSSGEDLHRRSLYTFWKRTMPHPAMTTFDSPDREFCTVRRSRTNTPLQALTLWNEPGFLEAARQLGTRMLREGGKDDNARVSFAFRLATGRRPAASERQVLATTLAQMRADFAEHGDDAYAFVKVGASPLDATIAPAELAAATAVANMILSLDETITKN